MRVHSLFILLFHLVCLFEFAVGETSEYHAISSNKSEIKHFGNVCEKIQDLRQYLKHLAGGKDKEKIDLFVNATLNIGSLDLDLNISVDDLEAMRWIVNASHMRVPLKFKTAANGINNGNLRMVTPKNVNVSAQVDSEFVSIDVNGEAIQYLPISAIVHELEFPNLPWRFILLSFITKIVLGAIICVQYMKFQQLQTMSTCVQKEMAARLLRYEPIDQEEQGKYCDQCKMNNLQGRFCSNCGNGLSVVTDS